MPTLTDLHGQRESVRVAYTKSLTITLHYNPALYSAQFADTYGNRTDPKSYAEGLAAILIGWDVTDDAKAPIEPTADLLMSMPYPFLARAMKAISTQMLTVGEYGKQAREQAEGNSPSG